MDTPTKKAVVGVCDLFFPRGNLVQQAQAGCLPAQLVLRTIDTQFDETLTLRDNVSKVSAQIVDSAYALDIEREGLKSWLENNP